MKQKPQLDNGLKVGDRVRLIPESLAWKAEMTLQDKIAEVIERREDGRVTVRYDDGRLLMGQDAGVFERVGELGLSPRFSG
jgi:hypothetical protein